MTNTQICPVCKNDNLSNVLQTVDYFLTQEKFSILMCPSCGYGLTYPLPKLSNLSKYYESPNYYSHTSSAKGVINNLYVILRKLNLVYKHKVIHKHQDSGSLLDIGCGTGEFLHHMASRGYKVSGLEPNLRAKEFAMLKYGLDIIDESALHKLTHNSYDVITLWHVLEHVYDIRERIELIKKLLKEDGYIVIAIPNNQSPDALYYNKYWAALDVPRHMHHFNKISFKTFIESMSLSLVAAYPLKMDAYYISLLSEKYKHGRTNYAKAFVRGYLSNLEARKKNNFSSMIFVLKK